MGTSEKRVMGMKECMKGLTLEQEMHRVKGLWSPQMQ